MAAASRLRFRALVLACAACLAVADWLRSGELTAAIARPGLAFGGRSRQMRDIEDDPEALEAYINLRMEEVKRQISEERRAYSYDVQPIKDEISRKKMEYKRTIEPWKQELYELEAVQRGLMPHWLHVLCAFAVGFVVKAYWEVTH